MKIRGFLGSPVAKATQIGFKFTSVLVNRPALRFDIRPFPDFAKHFRALFSIIVFVFATARKGLAAFDTSARLFAVQPGRLPN